MLPIPFSDKNIVCITRWTQQENLKWGCDWDMADRICNFNRHYAEFAGYWETTSFLSDVEQNIEEETGTVTFYDSGWKGRPLFTAPQNRSWADFIEESKKHGWPSFRDSEVDWNYARVLPGGEMVSVDGSHLGHNLPDGQGNRYCISKYLKIGVARRSTVDLINYTFVLTVPIYLTLIHSHLDLVSIAGRPTSDDSAERLLNEKELR